MNISDERRNQAQLLHRAAQSAVDYLEKVTERHVGALASGSDLRRDLMRRLPDQGDSSESVLSSLATAGITGTVASQNPRYFGFVTGGSLPAAIAADWLVSAWDQNAQVYVMSPLAAVLEEIAAKWVKELLRLPETWSVGFVTGAQMANFTALITARNHLLSKAGWDVQQKGLFGAPPFHVLTSAESHRTIFSALRMMGIGEESIERVPTDNQGRIDVSGLRQALERTSGPTIVCIQVGNVNTGSADPVHEIAPLCRERGAWLHIDGAFGIWAAASNSVKHLATAIEQADSIATDGHKWLNVPYDCGIVLTAHAEAHRSAMMVPAHYIQMTKGERDPRPFVPDESRRARGVPLYAALRTLGREGVAEVVDRCCACARRMASLLKAHPQVEVLNDVVLNQVLVKFKPLSGDEAAFTDEVVAAIQQDGTCWLGATQWQGHRAARISICNWSTTEADIDRSASAILRAIETVNAR
jgi:glutamate/tyrosine decarboxylase-like PLP-dependent enzyme